MEGKKIIEIIKHYYSGGDVELMHEGEWKTIKEHHFDFGIFTYRIKEPNQKVTIEKWLMQSTIDKEYRIIETSLVDKVVNFKKVKLIETYEVEL